MGPGNGCIFLKLDNMTRHDNHRVPAGFLVLCTLELGTSGTLVPGYLARYLRPGVVDHCLVSGYPGVEVPFVKIRDGSLGPIQMVTQK